MRWQKLARLAIAVFLVVFVGVVMLALRQKKADPVAAPPPPRKDKDAFLENRGGGDLVWTTPSGHPVRLEWKGSNLNYENGRSVFDGGVKAVSERNGRPFAIAGQKAEVTMKGTDVATASFTGEVALTSGDDLEVKGNEATFDNGTGIATVPGPVTFRRGRMRGSGVGATYDQNREVLWLQQQARITVDADKAGSGAVDASANAIGLARAEHYVRMQGAAHMEGEGRTIDADEVLLQLSEDDERIQTMELRGNSRIRGGGGASGPQAMSARDINLAYADDGRTLQHATLMENAVVQLPGGQGGGKRVEGKTIDIAMAPDGTTVTNLTATENVQLDLPAEGDAPARRIRSATLEAIGAPGAGLQNATFAGGVHFTETRAARGKLPALQREGRSERLLVETKPGLGAIQQADFRGNVRFTDGTEVQAEAPRGLYNVAQDRIDLSPGTGDPGPAPRVSDGRVTVEARTIEYTLGTRRMTADTRVRSSLLPRKRTGPEDGRLPALLKDEEPVNITSNRLDYDGAAGQAAYEGSARLWQGDETSIRADRIVIDDKNGNLSANGSVATRTFMNDVDPKTKVKKRTETIGKAEMFTYDDEKRLAIYTTKAQIEGAQGNVTADKLELFLTKEADELERAEGYGNVRVKEGYRTATGIRLTYTAADDKYVVTGTPVEVIEEKPDECKSTVGAVLTFRRAVDTLQMTGKDQFGMNILPCKDRRR